MRKALVVGVRAIALMFVLSTVACVFVFRNVEVAEVDQNNDVRVESPVKAHLMDGTTVVYPTGVSVRADTLHGPGSRFDLRNQLIGQVDRVPVDSVVGMETYRNRYDPVLSFATSVLATGAAVVGFAGLSVAIFGSCPTIYSDSAGVPALEAEGFSYSIAPMFEARDVDLLRASADSTGMVRLEIRNEALETHYLNHFELLEVSRRREEDVLPDERGRPLAVRSLTAPTRARDSSGRDVSETLASSDGDFFATDPGVLSRVSLDSLEDYIDLSFPAPMGADSAAIVLQLRNSLLTTVLFYDVMLALSGARSLDWIGQDLESVGGAVELGRWYAQRMGLHIAVWDGAGYRDVSQIADVGPIAWKTLGVMVPVLERDSVRVRMSFVADEWRIERISLGAVRRPDFRVVPPTTVTGPDGRPDPVALVQLTTPDEEYLRTSPSNYFTLDFLVGEEKAEPRTFLLASQGYYTEWVRGEWIQSGKKETTFRPGDEALLEALTRWRSKQSELETAFYSTRIPVR